MNPVRMNPADATAVPESDPRHFPSDVEGLCRMAETRGLSPVLLAALGDALVREGAPELAYRAFDRAQRMGHPDGATLQRKKDTLVPVSESTIRAEEHEGKVWVHNLQNYERARINAGEDPRDLDRFFEQWGRAEDSLPALIRQKQVAFWTAALTTILALALVIGSGTLRRRASFVPFLISAACLPGAPAGPFVWSASVLAISGVTILIRGKRD